MQPENSQPITGPEKLPMPPTGNGERIPVLPTPEAGIENGLERVEQRAEASAAANDVAASGVPVVTPVVDPVAILTTVTDAPITAADEDVIEKEWVDKAKKILLETKDDPHGRTERVNALQKDYLQKRYGKELGASE